MSGVDLTLIHAPGAGGGFLEPLSRGGAGLHDVGVLAAHEGPVDVEFLGDHHRDGGEGALPHLRVGDADADVAFGVDGEPSIDFGALRERGLGLGLDGGAVEFGEVEADEQAAGGGGGYFQEISAGDGYDAYLGA